MSQKIIYGSVKADGSEITGSGYTVVKNGTGDYTIVFDTGTFNNTPAVTATAVELDGNVTSMATLVSVGQDQFRLNTGYSDQGGGNRYDMGFNFHAIGEG